MSEKLKIIYRVHRKLQQHVSYSDYLSKASNYTGFHIETLKKLEESEQVKLDGDVDRNLIHSLLCRFYMRYRLDGGKLPTTYDLFDALNKNGKLLYMDIGSFRKLLKKMGFVWQKIEGQFTRPSVVVIESPLIRFEKFNYLTSIRNSRVHNRDDIYFIGEVGYNQKTFMNAQESLTLQKFGNTIWEQRAIFAVGVKSVVAVEIVQEFTAAVIEDWMIKGFLPLLTQPSIIVVPDFERFKTKLIDNPTLYSSKLEIASWLDYHNVPYEADMSKYQLYSLAEEYTDLETPIYKIDSILKARGHTLLRLPKYLKELNPAAILFETMKKNWNRLKANARALTGTNTNAAKFCFQDVLLSVTPFLESYTKTVVGMELKCVAQEMDVDLDMERLMIDISSSANASEIIDSDVASCTDSDSE